MNQEIVLVTIESLFKSIGSGLLSLFSSTTFLTIISGVLVFVASEYVREVWLSPLQEFKRIKQQISYALVFYADIYSNPYPGNPDNEDVLKKYTNASEKLREYASTLAGFIEIMPLIHLGIPSHKKIKVAISELIRLSNSMFFPPQSADLDHYTPNKQAADSIRENLGIKRGNY